MRWVSPFRSALFAFALASLIAPEEAGAVEIFTGPGPTMQTHMDDGLLTQVQRRGGGGMRRGGGGGHRGGGARFAGGGAHRGGAYRGGGARFAGGGYRGGGAYRGGAYRGGRYGVAGGRYGVAGGRYGVAGGRYGVAGGRYGVAGGRYGVWAGRPGWYRWPAGGAIAAGAALGWVSAAAASSWAGYPPQQGLCWYYTDASRHEGFWDSCP